MKKLILTLFICLSAIFYSECNVTDYYYELFGTNKDDTMFFLDMNEYNEKNIMFMKEHDIYVRKNKFLDIDTTDFFYVDNGYYVHGNKLYFLDKELMNYTGKIDDLRTYSTHNTKIDKNNFECENQDIGKNDFYLKMINGRVLYKNGVSLSK